MNLDEVDEENCEKFIGLREYFFHGKNFFFENFNFNKKCEIKNEDYKEKTCNRFRDEVSQKIDFTA